MRLPVLSVTSHPGWMGLLAGLFGVLALRLPLFAIPAAALVALPVLRAGLLPGGIAWLVGTAVVAGGWYGLGLPPGQIVPLVFLLWPVVVPMAEMLRRSGELQLPLLMAGAAMLAGVLAMHGITGDVVAFWQAWLRHALEGMPGGAAGTLDVGGGLRLINGFLTLLFGLGLLLSLLLARWLQARMGGRERLSGEFRRLALPRWELPLAVALVWAGGLWDAMLLADILMVGILVYAFVGLAVIHGVIEVRGRPQGWALPAYILLAFFPPQALAVLALVGAVDTFAHFRVQQPRRG